MGKKWKTVHKVKKQKILYNVKKAVLDGYTAPISTFSFLSKIKITPNTRYLRVGTTTNNNNISVEGYYKNREYINYKDPTTQYEWGGVEDSGVLWKPQYTMSYFSDLYYKIVLESRQGTTVGLGYWWTTEYYIKFNKKMKERFWSKVTPYYSRLYQTKCTYTKKNLRGTLTFEGEAPHPFIELNYIIFTSCQSKAFYFKYNRKNDKGFYSVKTTINGENLINSSISKSITNRPRRMLNGCLFAGFSTFSADKSKTVSFLHKQNKIKFEVTLYDHRADNGNILFFEPSKVPWLDIWFIRFDTGDLEGGSSLPVNIYCEES